MAKKLTLKEKRFIEETKKTLNPTEAVRRVYDLGSKGGSKTPKKLNQTARSIASENLTKPHIKREFKEALASIDDEVILERFYEILLDKDKRSALEAGKQLLKLKDRYPAGKLKLTPYTEKLNKLFEEENSKENN